MRKPTSLWLAMVVACGGLVMACTSESPEDSTHSGSGGATVGSGGGTSTSTSTGTGASTPTFTGYTRVDTAGSAMLGGADIAMAPDGTIYVSWVDQASDVFVARSTDGGESFGAAVQVDDAAVVPLVSMARHPYVAADNQRVAVVLGDETGAVHLYVASAGDALAFDQGTVIGGDIPTMFRDFPKAIFLADGDLAVAWHGYPTSGARIFVSRESDGFSSAPATGGAPGVPCECCPIDLLLAGSDLWIGFRNNDANIRDMWLAQAPAGGSFSNWVAGSTSEGLVSSCPMQGPRLAQTGAGEMMMVWSTRGSTNKGAAYISFGPNWSGGELVGALSVGDEPTIAVGGGGRIYVTAVPGKDQSAMTWSDDGGASWSPPEPLQAPDGMLSTPQAESGAGMAALAGVSASSSVWLLRME